jgi:hypothetical protein
VGYVQCLPNWGIARFWGHLFSETALQIFMSKQVNGNNPVLVLK